jgi:hypothetical protein
MNYKNYTTTNAQINKIGTDLKQADFSHLEKSFIPKQTAASVFRRVSNLQGAEILLRTPNANADYSGLVAAITNPTTDDILEYEIRRDNPDKQMIGGREKITGKYLRPVGSKSLPYFPPGTNPEHLSDANVPMIALEGIKKALACKRAATNDYSKPLAHLIVALQGVDNFKIKQKRTKANGEQIEVKDLLPELANITFDGREVIILFDANRQTNKNVYFASYRLAETLQSRGAVVYFADLPQGIEGVNGVDDLLGIWEREDGAAAAIEKFERLLKTKRKFVADAVFSPMLCNDNFQLKAENAGHGKLKISVLNNKEEVAAMDVFNPADSEKRAAFINKQIEPLFEITENDKKDIHSELIRFDVIKAAEKKQSENSSPKPSQATKILNFADDFELFHTADKEAFATIETDGHFENHLLRSKGFRAWLSWQFYQSEGQMPGTQAVQDAIAALEGKAIFDAPETEIHIRLASADGKIYLDLCNEKWQIVEISKSGWRIVESKDAPVKFYRTKAMLPLPMPETGGDVGKIRNYLTVDDSQYILICAFLVACLRPGYPFPIVIFTSEQGTGKSTAARILRRLVDPNKTDFRSAPREERDLVIAASNAWLCSYDNISAVPDWLSDALCRISTGGGFSTRTLYENTEETIFAAKRPILLNGIGEIANKGDLLDRAVLISLKPIPKNKRKTEAEFWREFEKDYASMFSGLLESAVTALQNIEKTELNNYPRMADFAQWAAAAETAFGFDKGSFVKAFEENQNSGNYIALEGSPFAEMIQKFAADKDYWKNNQRFEGNLQNFLDVLEKYTTDEIKKSKLYPKTPRGVRSKLERINPNLRAIGINIELPPRTKNGQLIILEQRVFQPSSPSSPSESPQIQAQNDDDVDDGWTAKHPTVITPSSNRQAVNTNKRSSLTNTDDGDDGDDGWKHIHSKEKEKTYFRGEI